MLAEYLFKYRMLKPWARALFIFIVGLLPGAYKYMEEADVVEGELADATSKEAASRQKLSMVKAQLKDLPALEAKQVATKEQLKKAESKLPTQIFVDQVLHMVSQYANESDVRIMKFEPRGNKLITGEYPYNEVRFKLSMEGHYGRLGEWLDSVGGAKSTAYVRNWKLDRSKGVRAAIAARQMSQYDNILSKADETLDPEPRHVVQNRDPNKTGWSADMADAARQDIRLAMETEFVMHSSATVAQLAEAAAAAAAAEAKAVASGEKKKDESAKTPADPKTPGDAKPKTGGGA